MNGSDDLAEGSLLAGRYRVGPVIGRGGMATVHRAQDEALARDVAVKVLTGAGATHENVERQAAEAQIGARLDHPGLVTVFDVQSDATPPFLVMELLQGITLSDAIARGPIAPEAAAEVGAQLCDALAAVHAAGVLHRDLKPSNVMLIEGDRPQVKLTDFGIARLVDATRMTSTGLLVGTARYLSPEQAGGEEIGRPTDIYSLGLVMLECRTGEHPFPGTQIETLSARLNRPPVIPDSLGPSWVGVIGAMTARNPADRPTAVAAAAAFRDLAAGRTPSLTMPPDASETRPIGAAGAGAAGAGLIGAAAAGGAAAAAMDPTVAGAHSGGAAQPPAPTGSEPTSTPPPDERGRRGRTLLVAAVAVAVLGLLGALLALQLNSGDDPSDVPTDTNTSPTDNKSGDDKKKKTETTETETEPTETQTTETTQTPETTKTTKTTKTPETTKTPKTTKTEPTETATGEITTPTKTPKAKPPKD